jgi:hypothetical protein
VSVPAIIRLAPILRLEDLEELQRRGRDVFERGSFKPLLEPVPVVVDHGERELGHVREFAYREAPERERGVWAFRALPAPRRARLASPRNAGFVREHPPPHHRPRRD